MPDNILIYVFIIIVAVIIFVVLLKTRGGAQEGEASDHGVSDSLAAAVEDDRRDQCELGGRKEHVFGEPCNRDRDECRSKRAADRL